jgi:multidrug efflux pump
MDLNIFVQVGFVVLVGLAAKNAILVVEFARDKRKEGMGLVEATLEASRTRLRPIIMTSFAFILGVFPLMIGQGAGAEMRRTLGTAVFAGMIGVTLFGIFLTPVFYFVIMWLGEGGAAEKAHAGAGKAAAAAGHVPAEEWPDGAEGDSKAITAKSSPPGTEPAHQGPELGKNP